MAAPAIHDSHSLVTVTCECVKRDRHVTSIIIRILSLSRALNIPHESPSASRHSLGILQLNCSDPVRLRRCKRNAIFGTWWQAVRATVLFVCKEGGGEREDPPPTPLNTMRSNKTENQGKKARLLPPLFDGVVV